MPISEVCTLGQLESRPHLKVSSMPLKAGKGMKTADITHVEIQH